MRLLWLVCWSEDEAGEYWHLQVCRRKRDADELAKRLCLPGVFNVTIKRGDTQEGQP